MRPRQILPLVGNASWFGGWPARGPGPGRSALREKLPLVLPPTVLGFVPVRHCFGLNGPGGQLTQALASAAAVHLQRLVVARWCSFPFFVQQLLQTPSRRLATSRWKPGQRCAPAAGHLLQRCWLLARPSPFHGHGSAFAHTQGRVRRGAHAGRQHPCNQTRVVSVQIHDRWKRLEYTQVAHWLSGA